MLKLSKYIFRQLAITTLFLTMVLTVAMWLTQSLPFINIIINKDISLGTFLTLIMYLLPELITIILPGALLITILFKYNRLITDNELIVMRAFGMSNWQIAKPVVVLALLVTFLLYFISLYLLPNSLRNLKDMEHDIKHSISGTILRAGEFNTLKGNTIYIRERKGKSELYGLIIHHKEKDKKPVTIIAKKGSMVDTDDGTKLVLFEGIKQEYDSHAEKPSVLNFDQYIVNLNFSDEESEIRQRKHYEYYITDLLFPNESMGRPNQMSKFIIRGHQKIIAPLHAIAFALFGIIVFLYGDYNRRGRSNRILIAVSGCILLNILTFVLMNFSEKLAIALPAAYMVIILPILLSIGYLKEWWFIPKKGVPQ